MYESFNPVVSALVDSKVPADCCGANYDVVERIDAVLSKQMPAKRLELHSLSKIDGAQRVVFRVDCNVSSLENASRAIKNALSAYEVDIKPVS